MTILMLVAALPYALMMATVDSIRDRRAKPTEAPETMPAAAMAADAWFQQADPTPAQLNFIIGWLISSAPEKVLEAAEAMETYAPKPQQEQPGA